MFLPNKSSRLRRCASVCCISLLVCGFSGSSLHQQKSNSVRYIVLDLGPSLLQTLTDTPGLNDAKKVAMWRHIGGKSVHGLLVHGVHISEWTGVSGFSDVYPADVNNSGTVVGRVQDPQDLRFVKAFCWSRGRLKTLPSLMGKYARATAVNQKGEIVGEAQTRTGAYHAVLWHAGIPRDLGTLAKGDYSAAHDINNQDIIVGEADIEPFGKPHAFIWKKGRLQQLVELPGSTLCSAQAVNDTGHIIGSCDRPEGGAHGVLWHDGRVTDLGALGEGDESTSTPLDVNVHTQTVGRPAIDEGKLRAFLWEQGSMVDLNSVIPANSGWLLQAAFRINKAGDILGRGFYKNDLHFFLLVPLRAR